jgi:dephospho-CoA kinase
MKLVILTGMPGAGKSEVAEAFHAAGLPVIVMGDVIRKEVKRRGMDVNPKNNKLVMLELRKRDGPGAVAKHCMESLKNSDSEVVVIEGCRSLAEVDVFDDYADEVCIVCVHSSPKVRFSRLQQRGRKDDPQDWVTFRERDLREVSVGLGAVIALSDIVVVNEGTIEELQNESRKLVQRFT